MRRAGRLGMVWSLGLVVCLFGSNVAGAQTASPVAAGESSSGVGLKEQNSAPPLVDAPKPQPVPSVSYPSSPSESYFYRVGAICGAGASYSRVSTKPTMGCGLGMTFMPLPLFFEFGLMGPQANRSNLSGYISLDGSISLARSTSRYLPLAMVGYSRLFETGHALDYGVALALPRIRKTKDQSDSLRIELRDYWTFASPSQHNVMIRIGWMGALSD